MTLELGLNLFSAREAMAQDADSTLATRPATSPAGSRLGSMALSGGCPSRKTIMTAPARSARLPAAATTNRRRMKSRFTSLPDGSPRRELPRIVPDTMRGFRLSRVRPPGLQREHQRQDEQARQAAAEPVQEEMAGPRHDPPGHAEREGAAAIHLGRLRPDCRAAGVPRVRARRRVVRHGALKV